MRLLLTGPTGFIGRRVVEHFARRGDEIIALTRNPDTAKRMLPGISSAYRWTIGRGIESEVFQDVNAVIHLAGEPVAGLWTKRKRDAIHQSRAQGTKELVQAMVDASHPPTAFISASAIGYYGVRGDEELIETSEPGNDFLARVCRDWEAEAHVAGTHQIRTVMLRTGIVLGTGGGALPRLLMPARLGVSGPLGSGNQWWSWIHIDDLVRLIEHAVDGDVAGPLNVTAPGVVRQKEFARTLGRVLRRPAFLPAPAPVLKAVLGGFSVELLGSKRVLPKRALEMGFQFEFPELEGALRDLLNIRKGAERVSS